MTLYQIPRFDLDCTYSTGQFYKNLPQPKFRTDKFPQGRYVMQSDSRKLPFNACTMKSIMFDPPFVIDPTLYGTAKKGSNLTAI